MSNLKLLVDHDAKQIVDLLYDTKVFKSDLTRDNLNSIEEFVSHLLETRVNSQIRKKELETKIKQ